MPSVEARAFPPDMAAFYAASGGARGRAGGDACENIGAVV
jgi:hypothetical protein